MYGVAYNWAVTTTTLTAVVTGTSTTAWNERQWNETRSTRPFEILVPVLADPEPIDVREVLLERARRIYRRLVRARRRALPIEARPTITLCPAPSLRRRRRARAEPMGLHNYHRPEIRR